VIRGGPPRLFYGWIIAVTAFFVYFFTNGMTLFVPQNLFPRLMETFGATTGEISRTTAISLGLSALLAPFAGAVIDRIGVLRVIRTGLTIMAICFSLYPFARSLSDLYLLHAGLALGLILSGLMANVVLLSNWFVARRGTVVGLLAAGSSLGGALLPLAISPIVNNPELGWRWAFGALAAAFWLCAVLPGFLLLRESPAVIGQFPDGAGRPAATSPGAAPMTGVAFGDALRSRSLWCLALGSACLWFSIQAVNSQLTVFLEREAGLSPQRATLLFASVFWASFVAKFLFGALSDRFVRRRVMLFASLVLLAGCLLLFEPGDGAIDLSHNPVQLGMFVIVFGLGFGGSFTMIQLVCVEVFGQRALGKILGTVVFVDALGAAAGTFLAGELQTVTGSYLAPFTMVTAVAVVAVINVLFIRPVPASD